MHVTLPHLQIVTQSAHDLLNLLRQLTSWRKHKRLRRETRAATVSQGPRSGVLRAAR
jgi:hypothetical protein